jgi:hypothetical protein
VANIRLRPGAGTLVVHEPADCRQVAMQERSLAASREMRDIGDADKS